MKKEINVWDYAGQILGTVNSGILLTTSAEGRVNTMTIGWGTLGVEWKKPIFTAFVRESRFTQQMLEKNPRFTISIPCGGNVKEILKVCGTHSGRDMDKIKELGLHLEEPLTGDVPGIRELPLTLECQVIYRQDQDPAAIGPELTERYYPKHSSDDSGDYHTAWYGEIKAAYIITDEK